MSHLPTVICVFFQFPAPSGVKSLPEELASNTPQSSYIEALTPSTSEYDYFVDKIFKEVIKFKWNPTGVLIRRRKLDIHREAQDTPTQRRGHVRTQREEGHLHTMERSLRISKLN